MNARRDAGASPSIRYALLACFVHVRTMDVIDDAVRMTLDVIRRIETQTEKHRRRPCSTISSGSPGKSSCSTGSRRRWSRSPMAISGPCFSPGQRSHLSRSRGRSQGQGPQYRIWYQSVMRQKYIHHYRQMLPWILEHLTSQRESLSAGHRGPGDHQAVCGHEDVLLPADAPVDGVVLPSWRETVIEEHAGTTRINRQYYELCVLQRLERALKCKEVWVEGAMPSAIPARILPANWTEETQRTAYYQTLKQPIECTS